MVELEQAQQRLGEYIRWKELPRRYPQLVSEGELRRIIAERHFNGFGRAVRKISPKKILIHIPTALRWIESRRG